MTDFEKWSGAALDRREAIRRVSVLLGGAAFVGGSALLQACADRSGKPDGADRGATIGTFTTADQALLDEIADTILPTTSKSPGAKAAATGPFMAVMVTDCYEPANQQIFREGLEKVERACQAMHQTGFMKATPAQRLAVITSLDQAQFDYMQNKKPEEPTHYFRMMKELALLGFFTSEIGCTQALRYKESPGPYQGCVPYAKGETAWADHA